jgi:hypothetical protein
MEDKEVEDELGCQEGVYQLPVTATILTRVTGNRSHNDDR